MAVTMAGLLLEARRNPSLEPLGRRAIRGELFIWLILAATGIVSILLAAFDATEEIAPAVYATLPLSIGLFTWRFDWTGTRAAAPPAETEDL